MRQPVRNVHTKMLIKICSRTAHPICRRECVDKYPSHGHGRYSTLFCNKKCPINSVPLVSSLRPLYDWNIVSCHSIHHICTICTGFAFRFEHRKWNRGHNGLHQLGQPVAPSILFPVFKSEGEPGTYIQNSIESHPSRERAHGRGDAQLRFELFAQ